MAIEIRLLDGLIGAEVLVVTSRTPFILLPKGLQGTSR